MTQVLITFGHRRGQIGERCNGFFRNKQKYYVVDFQGVREEIDLRFIVPATEKEITRMKVHEDLIDRLNAAKASGNLVEAKALIAAIKENNFGATKAR